MAEIRLDELTPRQITDFDNIVGYTEDKEVIIAIPDFVKSSTLDDFQQKASLQREDLSTTPSSITASYGNFVVLIQHLNTSEIVLSVGATGVTTGMVNYQIQTFGNDLAHSEYGVANFTNGSAQIGTFDSTIKKIVSEFDYNDQYYRATFSQLSDNYTMVRLYIEKIG